MSNIAVISETSNAETWKNMRAEIVGRVQPQRHTPTTEPSYGGVPSAIIDLSRLYRALSHGGETQRGTNQGNSGTGT